MYNLRSASYSPVPNMARSDSSSPGSTSGSGSENEYYDYDSSTRKKSTRSATRSRNTSSSSKDLSEKDLQYSRLDAEYDTSRETVNGNTTNNTDNKNVDSSNFGSRIRSCFSGKLSSLCTYQNLSCVFPDEEEACEVATDSITSSSTKSKDISRIRDHNNISIHRIKPEVVASSKSKKIEESNTNNMNTTNIETTSSSSLEKQAGERWTSRHKITKLKPPNDLDVVVVPGNGKDYSKATLLSLRKACSHEYLSDETDSNQSVISCVSKYSTRDRFHKSLIRRQVKMIEECKPIIEKKDSGCASGGGVALDEELRVPPLDQSDTIPESSSPQPLSPSSSSIDEERSEQLKRLSRQFRISRRGQCLNQSKRTNIVKIHVYDLIANEVVYPTPWGCNFPLGQCFNIMNDGMHLIGTGAYHVGVEVNGIEYAYGSNNIPNMSGIFTCLPKGSPGYQYRTTIDFGIRNTTTKNWISVPDPKYDNVELSKSFLKSKQKKPSRKSKRRATISPSSIPYVYREVETFQDGSIIMEQMSREYMGIDYDLLRRNCCTFARDACQRLGVSKEEIPNWFLSLCEAVVDIEDSFRSLDDIMSSSQSKIEIRSIEDRKNDDRGFELILKKRNTVCDYDVIKIVESKHVHYNKQENVEDTNLDVDCLIGLRQTLSWTY